MKKIEDMLYNEALKAYKEDEVPVGCVIVKDGCVIAKAHNKKQKTHLCYNHAEIIAISRAGKKLKDWRLDGCDLYVTLKPCKMCFEIIKAARIANVYYIVDSTFNDDSNNATYVEYNSNNKSEIKQLMSSFFKKKR